MSLPLPPGGDAPKTAASFRTTHWSVVLEARDNHGTAADEAFGQLCSTYWYPLYAFIRRQGSTPHEAEDLTQEFLVRFLERNRLTNVQPTAGRFRSFLLACLKNFLANERERARAQRRGGGRTFVSLDGTDAETRYALEPADRLTPEAVFERRWAFAVIEQTMADLRQEYSSAGKLDQFEELQGYLPCGRGDFSRAELAAKRGVGVGAIDVAIHRLRQRFGILLQARVAQTVSSEAEIEEELRYLIGVISV